MQKTTEIRELARRIDELMYSNDTYGYINNLGDIPLMDLIEDDLLKGKVKSYITKFENYLVEDKSKEEKKNIETILLRLNSMQIGVKIAILQLKPGMKNRNRRFLSTTQLDRIIKEKPNCENYDLIYIRNEKERYDNETEELKLCNRLYAEFNADTFRPRNYYGHSLSVGDVIVIVNDDSYCNVYFVEDMGFLKLPGDFLSRDMIVKISNNLDVLKEWLVYENMSASEVIKGLIITDKKNIDRAVELRSEYNQIFEMAERRGVIMDMSSLGYEPVKYDGFSENILIFKNVNNKDETKSFDDWDSLKDFVTRFTLKNIGFQIKGHDCLKIDEWLNGNEKYVLGQDIEDNNFFYALVVSNEDIWKGCYEYEFDKQIIRKDVEDAYLDEISMRDIDRQETEFGADGSCNFPNLNNHERITLYIRYAEPINFNGFNVTKDRIVFDSMENMKAFVNGDATYDYLDNSVRKKDNEILQYAEDQKGNIIWENKAQTKKTSETQYKNHYCRR